jgi:Tol biopolymer transport system component
VAWLKVRSMKRAWPVLGGAGMVLVVLSVLLLPAQEPPPVKVLIALASYRERPKHPNVFFYEHDGKASGKIIGSVGTPRPAASADAHPSLSHDGRWCAFTFEVENQTGRISLWDLKEQKLVEMAVINDSPNAQMGPSVSGDGNLIGFAAWNRPGASGEGWRVFLFDRMAKKLLDLPGLSGQAVDDRAPALNGDGRWLAFSSNRKGGEGLNDLYLYDRQLGKLIDVPGLNSNLIAFSSDRPGGSGGRDVYLFDRVAGKMVPLPGLNTTAHEYSPSLSPDGRFIAFVSERLGGDGERDLYLYDRQTQKLLPTPGLNSKADDFDPCVIALQVGE